MNGDFIMEVTKLSVSYYGKRAIEDITFPVKGKQIIGIIGPNGGGKTTLMKAIMGLIGIDEGKVRIMNQPVARVRKKIAYVPQRNNIDMDFPALVEDVVMMGRYPHIRWWSFPSSVDSRVVKESLEKVGMYEYRKRQIGELSGGQQQRVFLARALAQEAELFFFDEPFTGIDIASESMIMDILRELRDRHKTIFVVHHDLSKAEKYFDSLILIKKRLICWGNKEEVFQVDMLKEAYDGRVTVLGNNGGLMVVNS